MFGRRSVLCIDDDPSVLVMLRARLETVEKFKVHTAPDGEVGLTFAAKHKPDMILLDWMMPGFSGLETLMSFKRDERNAETPVFMLTAKATMGDVERALALGAADYIIKPFDLEDVGHKLSTWKISK